jgi:hypothetical protein
LSRGHRIGTDPWPTGRRLEMFMPTSGSTMNTFATTVPSRLTQRLVASARGLSDWATRSAIFGLLLAAGPAHAGLFGSSSQFALTDAILVQHLGDPATLYGAWLQPFLKDGALMLERESDWMPSEVAVADGFARFCRKSGYRVNRQNEEFGENVTCMSAAGEYVTSVELTRVCWGQPVCRKWWVRVAYDTAAWRAAATTEKLKEQQDYVAALARNGPTGWIQTSFGKRRLLRIGTLKYRQLMHVGTFSVDDLKGIEFPEACCNVVVPPRVGSTTTLNGAAIYVVQGPGSNLVGFENVLMVLIDPVTNQPYVWIPDRRQLRSIEFDDPTASTDGAAGGHIQTLLTVAILKDPPHSAAYARELAADESKVSPTVRAKVASTFAEGRRQEARDESFARISGYLEKGLKGIADFSCQGAPDTGITDLENPARCDQAISERAIVDRHSLNLAKMPLATILMADYNWQLEEQLEDAGMVTLPK